MSIVVSVWKCRSRVQSTRSQHVAEERGDVVHVELRIVGLVGDQQEFGERQLALAEDGVGLREQFLRALRFGERPVALAADRQQQRMHAGGIDGVDAVDAGQHVGITGPVSSWMSWPKIVSSCGGRPTTVNGQIAPSR